MLKIKKIFFPTTEVTHDELLQLFKERYLQERDFIRSSIYWMVNSTDVDDLVQDTFLKAWRSIEKFEEKSSFRTWIYRIAMNVTYDFLKKNNTVAEEFNENNEGVEEVDVEMSDLVSKGLMKLSIEQREAFSLHYQLGFTYKEVSELLDINEGTVKSRASGAKDIFVKYLKKNGVSDER